MHSLIIAIEMCGANYRLRLNRTKCVTMRNLPGAPYEFMDGTAVNESIASTYLGCELNMDPNKYPKASNPTKIRRQYS